MLLSISKQFSLCIKQRSIAVSFVMKKNNNNI